MGCNATRNANEKPKDPEDITKLIVNLTNDDSVKSTIQPLGAFGDHAFEIAFGSEFGAGKSWCLVNNQVYFSGGKDKEQDFGVIGINYEEKRAKLSYLTQMTTGRINHYLLSVNHGNTLLAIGGFDKIANQAISKCEAYNIKEDKWEPITDMPVAKYLFAACVFEDKQIYVFGGLTTGRTPSQTIELFDATSNNWTPIPVTPEDAPELLCGCLAVTLAKNAILVFGGQSEKCKIPTLMFNPQGNIITKLQPHVADLQMICSDEGVPVVFHKKRVYTISADCLSYYIYSTMYNSWTSAKIKIKF